MNTNAVPKTHKVRKGIASVIMNLILIIFSLSCIFPIVWMAYSSLKEKRVFNADIMGLPKNPTLINYIKILSNKDYHLGQSMMNSVRTTLISIVLIIVFSFIVGYILGTCSFQTEPYPVCNVPDGYADSDSFSSGSYLCSIPEMWNQQQMVYTSSSVCIFWSSNRYLPGRRLCKDYSGFTGRGCSY